ncbi:rhodanese-like domain-containing protein [Methylibium sp. Pch-M]|uniref:Putative transmembrane protein n=1 Tax=Methylibium petroleiphilum (strain ATCC BAA-1232 / LMG 22953 / PM1) TaxID=420662 RepID=A2SDN7_METPP|nr:MULTISPECIES: rhodanese-like domain-containing protein [Methylibium]ABM93676.1 putative transmembrane protein [Methylibium petroleiphilum PM1]QAZ40207.1 rhodanese-like domain-containing protein [Methylibium sp. Pch-M]
MKFLLDNWYLVLAALASGGLLVWPLIARGGGPNRVSTAEAVMLINREKAVLIDVSEPAEYAAGHASNARNIPLAGLESGAKGLPTNKSLPVLVICPTGARANRAVATLRKLGYEKASTVIGGLAAWREAQLPVEKSAA